MKSIIRKINPLVVLSIVLFGVLVVLTKNYVDEPDRLVCANNVDRAAQTADSEGQRYNPVLVECK
jgi:hypothetical protein